MHELKLIGGPCDGDTWRMKSEADLNRVGSMQRPIWEKGILKGYAIYVKKTPGILEYSHTQIFESEFGD